MKQFLLFIFLCFSLTVFSQLYEITYENLTYDTLTDYTSISIQEGYQGDAYGWEVDVAFGFDFPFYGNGYDTIVMDYGGYAYFSDIVDAEFEFFVADWVIAEITDPLDVNSDVRYGYMDAGGTSALVFEWHNVFLADELEENGENHHINYQVWFYETGVMEVRFGDIDLENCSYYFPGLGFSFDNQNPEGEVYGPWIGLYNDDIGEVAYLEGDHANPNLVYSEADFTDGVLTSVPDEGFVVRFSPIDVSVDESSVFSNYYRVDQTSSQLIIQGDMSNYISAELYDLTGRIVFSTDHNVIGTQGLSGQILFLIIESNHGKEVHRIVF